LSSRIVIDKHVAVPMRDGVVLSTDIHRPAGTDVMPAVLVRSPYDKERSVSNADVARFVAAGYAVVAQDTRGRYRSGGTFDPFVDEPADGEDTIRWLAGQDWCESVAMSGASYLGATQWMAAARDTPALRAIAPEITSSDYYEGWTYQGGAFQLGFALSWTVGALALPGVATKLARAEASEESLRQMIATFDTLAELYRHTPLADLPALRDVAPYYADWLAHPTYDAYWRRAAPHERYEDVLVPTLNIGGWYDVFLGGTLANYRGMRDRGGSEAARSGSRLVIGPWAHGVTGGEFAEASFGFKANAVAADLVGQQIGFFDRHVRGIENGLDDKPPVSIFVMGGGGWRAEADWPLPDTQYTDFYLHSGGSANTAGGDGLLSPAPPADEPCDIYVYDPRDPAPTVGGQTFLPGLLIGANAGPRDQRSVERRRDVLCFTTPSLERDIEVTGPVALVLHASSSARDTDFTGKLVDVHPDGRAVILTEGILRARHRRSTSEPELLEPERVYELRIDVRATANVFAAGHRIRLEVSSSNFPRFDRNTNTGGAIATESLDDAVPAINRVFHDAAHPSRLVLPIVDRR
jgi:uncharacterized protein